MLNAMFDDEYMCPVGAVQACTAVITAYTYTEKSCTGAVIFKSPIDIKRQIVYAFNTITRYEEEHDHAGKNRTGDDIAIDEEIDIDESQFIRKARDAIDIGGRGVSNVVIVATKSDIYNSIKNLDSSEVEKINRMMVEADAAAETADEDGQKDRDNYYRFLEKLKEMTALRARENLITEVLQAKTHKNLTVVPTSSFIYIERTSQRRLKNKSDTNIAKIRSKLSEMRAEHVYSQLPNWSRDLGLFVLKTQFIVYTEKALDNLEELVFVGKTAFARIEESINKEF
ncbi:hypothetical protein EJ04DRAFT_566162 [Polyplosphaeria fusca]|uniref:Uncharacterized protein n=1 Tax=Polyplosphaeria fusca TaxID=682080 RepID=A0A9P4UXL7_9PLEO|nr:hypothetical protein EJ04DRAFT_566162 [Polyplosphaeria fusca]